MRETLLVAVTSLLSSIGTWLFARRKNKADAKISELKSVEMAIAIWREAAVKLTEEVTKLREENKTLYAEINKLKSINNRILSALKNITPDNAKEVVEKLNSDIEGHA